MNMEWLTVAGGGVRRWYSTAQTPTTTAMTWEGIRAACAV
jgi:hypothetical protein